MKTKKEIKRHFCRFIISLIVLGIGSLFWIFKIFAMLPEALRSVAALAALAADVIAVVVLMRSLSAMTKVEAEDDAGELPPIGCWIQEEVELPPATMLKLRSIKRLLDDCDIIEFIVSSENGPIRLGATAETLTGKSEFLNKKYYLGDKIYGDIHTMCTALEGLFPEEELGVFLIDGQDVEHWNIPC